MLIEIHTKFPSLPAGKLTKHSYVWKITAVYRQISYKNDNFQCLG
jgi:hypothetical protein